MINQGGAEAIAVSSSYGDGADGAFLDSPKAEGLWGFATANDLVVHIHPPMLSVGHEALMQYRPNEAVGRPFDSTFNGARMIASGVFDRHPKLQVLIVHLGGGLTSIVGCLDFNWRLSHKGVRNLPAGKPRINKRLPSETLMQTSWWIAWGPTRSDCERPLKCAVRTGWCLVLITVRCLTASRSMSGSLRTCLQARLSANRCSVGQAAEYSDWAYRIPILSPPGHRRSRRLHNSGFAEPWKSPRPLARRGRQALGLGRPSQGLKDGLAHLRCRAPFESVPQHAKPSAFVVELIEQAQYDWQRILLQP